MGISQICHGRTREFEYGHTERPVQNIKSLHAMSHGSNYLERMYISIRN